MNYRSEATSKRKSNHYALGCSNYANKNTECNVGLIYVDAYKDSDSFIKIEPCSIVNRNNWGEEKVTKTILDEIEMLESSNQILNKELNKLKNENRKMSEDIVRRKKLYSDVVSENKRLIEENKKLECIIDQLYHFRKIFGNIYFWKD